MEYRIKQTIKYLLILMPVVFAAAACDKTPAYRLPDPGGPASQTQTQQQAQVQPAQSGIRQLPALPPMPPVRGVLKISDNPDKGNFMLVQTDATDGKTGKNITIYLETKRDFSAALNKQVIATIEGAPGQFILDDVKEVTDETANWTTYGNPEYGTLKGQVSVGPICPVESVEHPCTARPEAYTSREVIIYASDGKTVVTKRNFNADGTYEFSLPVGQYIIGIPSTGVGGSRDLPKTITITAGQTVTFTFNIDTGLR